MATRCTMVTRCTIPTRSTTAPIIIVSASSVSDPFIIMTQTAGGAGVIIIGFALTIEALFSVDVAGQAATACAMA